MTVVYASAKQPRLARYGIFVDRCGRLIDVNECISAAVKIPPEMVRIFDFLKLLIQNLLVG